VTDKSHGSDDSVWNVEEHRHTKLIDEKERERDMVGAEFMPLAPTSLSFWEKMKELQYKMLLYDQENIQEHMYSVESPLDLFFLKKGIAYWLHAKSNVRLLFRFRNV
jgi:dolichyl-phosphate-mannose-protein mannosyltransferase